MPSEIKAFIKRRFPIAVRAYRGIANIVAAPKKNTASTGDMRERESIRSIEQRLNAGSEICIEVGAGNKRGENGWITIDITNDCDIYWDLRKGLPFPDCTVSKIYSSHFMEHLSYREAQIFLDECLRVLKPGGSFSICVPNARLYIQAYMDSRPDVIDLNNEFVYKPAFNNTTKIDYVNYMAYMNGEHKYMFDEENLVYLLQAKGFRNARSRGFDPALDIKGRDFESIYAEAEKQVERHDE